MIAEFDKDGFLVLKAENGAESIAINFWVSKEAEARPLKVITDFWYVDHRENIESVLKDYPDDRLFCEVVRRYKSSNTFVYDQIAEMVKEKTLKGK